MKKLFRKNKNNANRTLTFDPTSEKPLADYLGTCATVTAFTESEFKKDFAKDNDYGLFDHIKFVIRKYKALIVTSVIALAAFVIFLLVKFNT